MRFQLMATAICLFVFTALVSAQPAKPVQPLIDQGNTALTAKDYKAAQDAFAAALKIDPKSAAASDGLGMAYLGQKEFLKAEPFMDRAVQAHPNDREIVYNAAAAHVGAKNCMRAAKVLKEYLDGHPQPDEPMANALAISLNSADDQSKRSGFFTIASNFYKTYNAKLEALAPGMKRWGTAWITTDDAAQKQADAASKQKDADAITKEIALLDKKIAGLKSDQPDLARLVRTGFEPAYKLERNKSEIEDLQSQRDTKQQAYTDTLAGIAKPTYPAGLEAVATGEMPPPDVHGNVTVAAVDPQIDPKQPAPKLKKPRKRAPIPTPGSSTPASSTPDRPVVDDPPLVVKGSTGTAPEPSTPTATDPPADPPVAPPEKPVSNVQHAAAFPVAANLVIAPAASVDGASKIELVCADGSVAHATVVRTDADSGLALLRITDRKMNYVPIATDYAGGDVQCAAFMTFDLFNPVAQTIAGSTPAPVEHGWKISLEKTPRLAGAPLVANGKIVGVQLGDRDSDPAQVPAATLQQLKNLLGADAPTIPGKGKAVDLALQLTATKAP